jgi:hypothetical protein
VDGRVSPGTQALGKEEDWRSERERVSRLIPGLLRLRNTFGVTINAAHRMNIVRAFAVDESRVHFCHIELAVRDGRVTILAALF